MFIAVPSTVRKGFSSSLLSPCHAGVPNPASLQVFVGGTGIALAGYSLLLLNDSVFKTSGFIHPCYRGAVEPAFSVGGLIIGGVVIGALRLTVLPSTLSNVSSLPIVAVFGLLTEIEAKVGRTSRQKSPV